jgi:hypothetical protein
MSNCLRVFNVFPKTGLWDISQVLPPSQRRLRQTPLHIVAVSILSSLRSQIFQPSNRLSAEKPKFKLVQSDVCAFKSKNKFD